MAFNESLINSFILETEEKLIKEKKMSPLAIGDEVYLVSDADSLLPRIKKVEVVNIIQDTSKTFNFEAKVKRMFSKDEIFVYFKDSDIGEKAFKTKEEMFKAGIAEIEDSLDV